MGRNEKWVKDIEKEREQAIVKFKQMKSDKEKSEGAVLARVSMVYSCKLMCNLCKSMVIFAKLWIFARSSNIYA